MYAHILKLLYATEENVEVELGSIVFSKREIEFAVDRCNIFKVNIYLRPLEAMLMAWQKACLQLTQISAS